MIQHTKEKGDGVLSIHLWKGRSETSFVYYEDDGNTYDYEKESYQKMKIDYKPGQELVQFGAKEGNYRSRFDRSRLVLHQFDPVSQVSVDGNARPVKAEGNVQVVEWDNKREAMSVQFRR